jgi:hypothetical protein
MSRFMPPSPFDTGKSKKTQSQRMLEGLRMGKSLKEANAIPTFEQLYAEKLAQLKKDALGGKKYEFQLPGTEKAERGVSAGAQQVLEKMAEKKAKKEHEQLKKKMNEVRIIPKGFTGPQGGRIDRNGNIFDASGKQIMKVDKATGKIKAANGNTVGKYKPDSPYTEHKICELIAKLDSSKKGDFRHGTPGHGVMGGSIWGGAKEDSGGSVWGSGGGNVWGNNDDNNGGFWG